MAKSLQDKVIIVTGAGRGIGREIALLCAAEGAKVVVNDPGVAADGAGTTAAPAEEVVEEIKKRGGTAVANFEIGGRSDPGQQDRQDGDRSFRPARRRRQQRRHPARHDLPQMSVDAFEAVIKVHLMGSFYVSHAAARLYREQESGSFVHFTSTSGLIGNFGQANYAAAKLGIVGLSKSIALDMGRFNVRSNCVSPFAWTRMIGTIPTETEAEKARVEKIKQMGPEKIAPVCAYLCSRCRQGRHRADLRRAHERDLPVQPEPPAALGASQRRLDAADHRRARHAGAEAIVLQARSLGGHLPLGSDLSHGPRRVAAVIARSRARRNPSHHASAARARLSHGASRAMTGWHGHIALALSAAAALHHHLWLLHSESARFMPDCGRMFSFQ